MTWDSGFLLGGRLRHDQAPRGFRTGIEPVLLAASVPARPGARVLELGSASGAGLLCLAHRVSGLLGVGLERDADQSRLARHNALANGLANLLFVTGDVGSAPFRGGFDHVFANPPYHSASGTGSPDARRESAKRATSDTLREWTTTMAASLRHRGTMTLILPVALLSGAMAAITAAGCAVSRLMPLWPREGQTAKLIILRGVKGGRMGCALLSGLVLHEQDGAFTPAARAVLWDGAALLLDQ